MFRYALGVIAISLVTASLSSFASQTTNDIRQTVRKNISDIQGCYKDLGQEGMKAHKGRVSVIWHIDDTGKVTRTSIDDSRTSVKHLPFQNCIMDKSRTWKFPPSPKGVINEVKYPFNFSPD